MQWPTIEEVRAATKEEIIKFWTDLPLPYTLSEMVVMEAISIRYHEFMESFEG